MNSVDFGQYLYSQLSPRLPAELQQLFTEGFIAIGAINEPSPNAYVKSLGEDGYAIVFHTGLRDFIYRLARVLSTRFLPSSEDPTSHQAPPFPETARLVAEIFWWFQETGCAFGPSYEISDQQLMVANKLATEAELFLVSHEIGHVIADLPLDRAFIERIALTTTDGDHRDEHAADAIAVRLAMDLFNAASTPTAGVVQLRYAGVEFALRVFATLETLGFRFHGTHPSASSRLTFIRAEVRRLVANEQAWDGVTLLARGIESLFDEMATIMRRPAEHESFFVHAAEAVVRQLVDLLEKCTGGFVPDYMTFYQDAGAVFAQGYSHRLLSEIASVSARFFSEAGKVNPGSRTREQAWRDFQKFKLLWGFIVQHMNEPARSVFLRTFDDSGLRRG